MATRGRSARKKGHVFEIDMMHFFKSLGYITCKTSRNESKTTDDQKIDLCFTGPFNVQCKAHENLRPSVHQSLYKDMPQKTGYNLHFHKRNNKGTVVSMRIEDFETIFNHFMKEKLIKNDSK